VNTDNKSGKGDRVLHSRADLDKSNADIDLLKAELAKSNTYVEELKGKLIEAENQHKIDAAQIADLTVERAIDYGMQVKGSGIPKTVTAFKELVGNKLTSLVVTLTLDPATQSSITGSLIRVAMYDIWNVACPNIAKREIPVKIKDEQFLQMVVTNLCEHFIQLHRLDIMGIDKHTKLLEKFFRSCVRTSCDMRTCRPRLRLFPKILPAKHQKFEKVLPQVEIGWDLKDKQKNIEILKVEPGLIADDEKRTVYYVARFKCRTTEINTE